MKRLRGTRSWSYDSLMLFREDLDELLRLLNPTGAEGVITIADDQAEYDSLDDMKSHLGHRIYHIMLRSKNPHIVLNLRTKPKSLSLNTFEATDQADITFFKTNEFLQPKWRPLNTFVVRYLIMMFMIGITIFTNLLSYFMVKSHPKVSSIVGWSFLALFPVAIFILSKLDKRTALFMSLGSRQEYKPFTARKKDELIMLAIGTLLGALVTLIVSYLLK